MPEAIQEQAVCEKCEAPYREDTQFCYNCGSPKANNSGDPSLETDAVKTPDDDDRRAALEDLEKRFKVDEATDLKLAQAATERKKARISQRKPKEYAWTPKPESSNLLLVVVSILVAAIVGAVVLFTLFWK